jgi:hypothetical protein
LRLDRHGLGPSTSTAILFHYKCMTLYRDHPVCDYPQLIPKP